ncbi:hypothetical protein GGC64_006342 [Mycobacterium sp. OAS707]|nr:hypothetical protein [Mycobacterium sp. OAS707]MBE1552255.1 hypothetical protein [Mycobacterium sp. OAS707]
MIDAAPVCSRSSPPTQPAVTERHVVTDNTGAKPPTRSLLCSG